MACAAHTHRPPFGRRVLNSARSASSSASSLARRSTALRATGVGLRRSVVENERLGLLAAWRGQSSGSERRRSGGSDECAARQAYHARMIARRWRAAMPGGASPLQHLTEKRVTSRLCGATQVDAPAKS